MKKPAHIRLSDLHGFRRLATDATLGLADLVEAMHHTIVRTPGVLGRSPAGRTRGITGIVYRSVRGVTRLAGTGAGALLDMLGLLGPLIAERPSSQEREALLAALNGILGDYLAATSNPLAINMTLRTDGTPLPMTRPGLASVFPKPVTRVAVLVHGLCLNDLQWSRDGHDHGAALARNLDFAPVYLNYNTGRHISTNGREFGDLMEALVRAWPHRLERLVIVAHSMGGLVARSACHYAALAGHRWPGRLDDLVFLGVPHFGAPLERAGARADYLLELSPYTAPFARLGKVRSAGIRDLRHGNLLDDDWQPGSAATRGAARGSLPLPVAARCYAAAASRQSQPGRPGARIRGDGLVPVDSALGRHADAATNLAFPDDRCWIGYGMGHFDLLGRRQVCERILQWLADARPTGTGDRRKPGVARGIAGALP